jgi:hypothetical protein
MVDYLKEQLIKEAEESIAKELDENRRARNKRKAKRKKAKAKINYALKHGFLEAAKYLIDSK